MRKRQQSNDNIGRASLTAACWAVADLRVVFGKRIRQLRDARKMPQEELAHAAGIHVSLTSDLVEAYAADISPVSHDTPSASPRGMRSNVTVAAPELRLHAPDTTTRR